MQTTNTSTIGWAPISEAKVGTYYYCVTDERNTANPFGYHVAALLNGGWVTVKGEVIDPVLLYGGVGRPESLEVGQ
jgi:hypothetical protein